MRLKILRFVVSRFYGTAIVLFKFRVSRRRREMYSGRASVCLSVCPQPHAYNTARTLDVTWGMIGGAP